MKRVVLSQSLRRSGLRKYSYSEDQKRREKRDQERKKMPPVQADSLSALMKRADEPPRYLNPTLTASKPLVLYVVRVPGSQDLFLTTMHPIHSTVTAEDINACLYYIHIHTPTPPETPPPRPNQRPQSLPPPPERSGRRWNSSLNRFKESLPPLPVMTIVRRDPASGSQWNVAQVGASPLPWTSAVGNSSDRILIEILTEGYTKFLPPAKKPFYPPPTAFGPPVSSEGDSSWHDFGYRSPEDERAAWETRQRAEAALRPEMAGFRVRDFDEEEDRVFRREMWIEGVGFWNRMKHMGGHRKTKSHDSTGEGGEKEEGKEKVKKRGYVFESCWGDENGRGRCEFKDEGAGKILKCKYYPPVPTATHKSSLLSVIEFKPPSTTVISTRSRSRRRSTASGALKPSSGSSRSPSPHSSQRDPPPSDEFITSEKAKLATMVVHADGLQMVDLLIAANMAVFWRRWEGWSRERAALGGL
ncbi:hypothetical protein RUND412_001187 [Rhizina undulata]